MKLLKLIKNLPLPPDRNREVYASRNGSFTGNSLKKHYQDRAMPIIESQLDGDWVAIETPVFIVFDYYLGYVKATGRGKFKREYYPQRCDTDNVSNAKSMLDCLTYDKKKGRVGVIRDDSRRYLPLPPLHIQSCVDVEKQESDRDPCVDAYIYDFSQYYDFEKNRYDITFLGQMLHDVIRNL